VGHRRRGARIAAGMGPNTKRNNQNNNSGNQDGDEGQ
jgi:hypothetical protein